ncbi:MAG: hypothetical protein ACLFPD_05425 [Desulfosudaceae bacterium]
MTNFPITVLNPDGRDPARDFSDYAGEPRADGHPPVNFHAYAACTGGSFERNVAAAIGRERPVLVLIRSDFTAAHKAVDALRRADLPVAVTLKETGFHQVAGQLASPRKLGRLREILAMCDGVISPTEPLLPFYAALAPHLKDRLVFIPTPYPVESEAWDFSRPLADRSGIFLGTREFSVVSRNHLQALVTAGALARQADTRISFINEEGRRAKKYLERLELPAELVNPLPRRDYPAYLATVAEHRVVFQLDLSQVPGQIAGDAVLCRLPCLGGNGAVDQLVWPEYAALDRSALLAETGRLLQDDEYYRQTVAAAGRRAEAVISFAAGRAALVDFFLYIS